MGIDISYQAMPAGCALLERSKRDPEFGCYLEFFDSYAKMTQATIDHRKLDNISHEFAIEAKSLAAKHPGLEERYLYAGRTWDRLHYLMSEFRRHGETRHSSDWVAKVLFGGEVLNPETQTTIGIPIRYSTPVEVAELLEQLGQITHESLRAYWNAEVMVQDGVYKMHSSDDDKSFGWICESLEELKRFYAQVAAHAEGVLVCMG
jgi:hypothetical protein